MKTYLVVVQLDVAADQTVAQRISEDLSIIMRTLSRMATGELKRVVSEARSTTAVVLMNSTHSASAIRREVYAPGAGETLAPGAIPRRDPSGFKTHDKFLIVEVGDEFDAMNLSTIQHALTSRHASGPRR